jgi:cytochrome c-type biogenesis protein CcmH/NrfG
VPAQFEPFRAKLEQNPDDHATRLSLARELVKMGDIVHGLQHYQTLVENVAESDTVSEDLVALISQNPTQPVARRLLGDLYMRQGYLQEALDAYRGALDNL